MVKQPQIFSHSPTYLISLLGAVRVHGFELLFQGLAARIFFSKIRFQLVDLGRVFLGLFSEIVEELSVLAVEFIDTLNTITGVHLFLNPSGVLSRWQISEREVLVRETIVAAVRLIRMLFFSKKS